MTLHIIHETPTNKCSACGYVMDRATTISGDDAPSAGDISVCLKCGCIAMYTPDLRLIALLARELQILRDEFPQVYRQAMAVQRQIRMRL